MKPDNQLRLARKASADVWHGGAAALTLAKRITRITGSTDAEDIVNRVYTHPRGVAAYECRECGQEYVDPDEAHACCTAEQDGFLDAEDAA